MFARLVFACLLACALTFALTSSPVLAEDGDAGDTSLAQKPASYKEMLAASKPQFLHAGPDVEVSTQVCAVLEKQQIGCDFQSRFVLAMFLAAHDKPIVVPSPSNPRPPVLREFLGTKEQNALLAAAVTRNARLIQGGDITAERMKYWK